MNALNPYLKAAVAILGTVVTSLTIYYPDAQWLPVVTSVVTALTVYLTPNLPKPVSNPNTTVPVRTGDGWEGIK